MVIIGEKINTSLKTANAAVDTRDAEKIKELAIKQAEAGADYIDVNCGTYTENEPELLEWIVEIVSGAVKLPLCIDSPNPLALKSALKANKSGKPIINSITGEKSRFEAVLPLVKEYDTKIIALCMDDSGMPDSKEDRVRIAGNLIEKLVSSGVKIDDIYVDPMIRPAGVEQGAGITVIETIRTLRDNYPEVHITGGLSNISFGIPARKNVNHAFAVAAIMAGMDSAILDPLDKKLMSLIYAADVVSGRDEYCMNYIEKYRNGLLEL